VRSGNVVDQAADEAVTAAAHVLGTGIRRPKEHFAAALPIAPFLRQQAHLRSRQSGAVRDVRLVVPTDRAGRL
jgi:hypothetical protein